MASESKEKLERCFLAVFPEMDLKEFEQASTEKTLEWDSMASVMLYSLISQEFGIKILPEKMVDLNSFSTIYTFLAEEGKIK